MKITDLLQDFEETTVQLPSAEDISVQRIKLLVHEKLPRRRRRGRVLLVAAVVALMGLSACAVGLRLWDRAREDLGLAPNEELPEYVEYEPEKAEDDLPTASVVSALWTNTASTIYISIENPLIEMTVPRQDTPWNLDLRNFSDSDVGLATCRVEHVSYDEEKNVVLLRCDMSMRNLDAAETCSFALYWSPSFWPSDRAAMKLDPVTVENPQLRQLQAAVNAPYDNPYMNIQGIVVGFDVYANSFRVTMEVPPFEQACEMLGGYGNLAAAYWNTWAEEPDAPEEFDELTAIVGYDRSWRDPWDDFAIIYEDGTKITFDALDYQHIGLYGEDNGYSFGIEFRKPVDLDRLEAIYYHGAEYPLLPVQ